MTTNSPLSIDSFIDILQIPETVRHRISDCLINDLYLEAYVKGSLHYQEVMNEITCLENGRKSKTKPAQKLKRGVLKGLWHKHHRVAGISSLALNAHNAINSDKFIHDKIERILVESNYDPHIASTRIAELNTEGLFSRFGDSKGTGEWIVFAKYGGKNYYLCLAKHGTDNLIREKVINKCCTQFPFIRSILE